MTDFAEKVRQSRLNRSTGIEMQMVEKDGITEMMTSDAANIYFSDQKKKAEYAEQKKKGDAVTDFMVDTGKAAVGGVRDAAQGFIEMTGELGEVLNEKLPAGYITFQNGEIGFSQERPENMEEIQLPEIGESDRLVPQLVRGITQFATGMAVAPIKGAGFGANMMRGGFADALFDPEDGSISTALKELGLSNDVLDFFDSKVDADADAEERLKARMTQAVEGLIPGAVIDGAVSTFRAAKSDEGLRQTIINGLRDAGENAQQRLDENRSTLFSGPGKVADVLMAFAGNSVYKKMRRIDSEFYGGKIDGDNYFSNKNNQKVFSFTNEPIKTVSQFLFDRDFQISGAAEYGNTEYYKKSFEWDDGLQQEEIIFRVADHIPGRSFNTDLDKISDINVTKFENLEEIEQYINKEQSRLLEEIANENEIDVLTEVVKDRYGREIDRIEYTKTNKLEPGVAKLVLPKENEPGIIAFHGSGADFDEFKLEKIGTGEGAQAYGYGLYFTDSEDIAKFYKEAMEQPKYLELEGKPLDSVYTADNEEKFANYVNRNFDPEDHDDVYFVLDNLGQGVFSLDDADGIFESSFSQGAQKQIYQKIKQDLVEPEVVKGKTYKVALAPKPDELLDYDLPIDEQTYAIKEKLLNGLENINDRQLTENILLQVKASKKRREAIKLLNKELDDLTDSLPNKEGKEAFLKLRKLFFDKKHKSAAMVTKADMEEEQRLFDQFSKAVPPSQYPDIDPNIIYDVQREMKIASPKSIGSLLPQNKTTADALSKAGIPGIKYFDNSSRNTAGGKLIDVTEAEDGFRAKVAVDNRPGGLGGSGRIVTTGPRYKTRQEALDWADEATKKSGRNYVIFDDKLISIMEKYGIVGPVGITAMAANQDQDDG